MGLLEVIFHWLCQAQKKEEKTPLPEPVKQAEAHRCSYQIAFPQCNF